MKKILFAILMLATGIGIPVVRAADAAFQPHSTSTTKKHKRIIKRHTSTKSSQRAKMQQRQAEQHLKDDKKVQQVQHEAKKDSTGRHK